LISLVRKRGLDVPIVVEHFYRNILQAMSGKSCGQANSAAIRLLGRLIPLIGRQISAVRRRSGIRV
jgi:hypothetical protein